jgi:hypothetical protein
MTIDEPRELASEQSRKGPAIEALEERIKAHPGTEFVQRREELARGVAVWGSNTKELMRHIRLAETNEELQMELMQNLHDPAIRDRYMAKLDQKLHNALAAVVSLVEQTRPFLKHYEEKSPLRVGFEERSAKVRDVPAAKFLRRFRNYLLHYGVAPFVTNMVFVSGGTPKTEITLDARALLEWDDWTAVPRLYLIEHPEGVQLGTIVHEYSLAMNALYEWLIRELADLHQDELDEVNGLIVEQNKLIFGGVYRDRASMLAHFTDGHEGAFKQPTP